MKSLAAIVSAVLAGTMLSSVALARPATAAEDPLLQAFPDPPQTARPVVAGPSFSAVPLGGPATAAEDPLLKAFRDPPQTARPRVWWHWMNGNVSKAGIQKDMEWMKRVGIGGLQNFDAKLLTPQI